MHVNVWEWCEDVWHSKYINAPIDGSAWISSDNNIKTLRGGSWNDFPQYCRSATRGSHPFNCDLIGFRLVCASLGMS